MPLPLAYTVSAEKLVDGLLCNWLFFVIFKILFIFNHRVFNYYVSWYRYPWVHLVWGYVKFLDLSVHFLSQVKKFSAIIFSDTFLVICCCCLFLVLFAFAPFLFSSLSGTNSVNIHFLDLFKRPF